MIEYIYFLFIFHNFDIIFVVFQILVDNFFVENPGWSYKRVNELKLSTGNKTFILHLHSHWRYILHLRESDRLGLTWQNFRMWNN